MKNTGSGIENDPHFEARCDLAAVFRWTARMDMHEAVVNHFSYAVSDDGSQFLVNPNGRHFSRIRASELLLVDANDDETLSRADAPEPTAWYIHGAMHRNVSHARCILHLHPRYATVLASLADSTLPPIDQNTMRFYGRTVVDDGFDGLGLGDEAERLTRQVQDCPIIIMGNHGVMAVAQNIALAFDDLYYFERACENYILALQTGKRLRIATHEVAQKTSEQWQGYVQELADAHLREIREILDREEPDYRQ
ncbi:MAG: class II aldolase and adducin N-terminal domain-containing protein [Gammaproteobacteria bacterium]|nr:class II aldolase and adducin N-terminal domain-containing protein [Gammaproteobacteria bacterium]